jgi:hypothetical protein
MELKMNRKSLTAPLVAGLSLATVLASAQSQNQINFGGSVGLYLPSSALVRDAFGKSVLSIGVSPVSSSRPSSGSLTPSFQTLSADQNGNRLFIGTFTYGYEYHVGDDTGTVVPFARGFGGASYFDFGISEPSGRQSLKRVGFTYGAEIGAVIGKRLQVSARYNVYSKEDYFDFNGITLSATYAIISY